MTFDSLFDISQIRFEDCECIVGEFGFKNIKANLRTIIVESDDGVLLKIEQNKKNMTIEDIEKELGYKVNIVENN